MNFPAAVALELERARLAHPNQRSVHESYAIILEELDEFWDEVRKRKPDPADLMREIVQVAAMCQRCAEDVIAPMLPASEPDLTLTGEPAPKRKPSNDAARFIEWWLWGYQKFRGAPYLPKWAREAPIVAELLKTYGMPRLKQMSMFLWHDEADPWIQTTDRGIGILRSKANTIADWISQTERKTRKPVDPAPEP